MNSSSSDKYNRLDDLAQEFAARMRAGERPTLQEYIERNPDLAVEIREVFPALAQVEHAGKAAPVEEAEPQPALKQVAGYRIVREVGRGGMGVVYEAEQVALGRRVALKVLPRSALGDGRALERFRREARSAAKLHHTNIVPVFEVGQDCDVCFYAMQLISGQGLDLVIDELHRLRTASGQPRAGHAAEMARSLLSGEFSSAKALTECYAPNDSLKTSSGVILPGKANLASASTRLNEYFRSVARVGEQVAQALAFAHSRGIVHRDIKPSNLLLDASGVVWVTDFGLAKSDDDGLTKTGDIVGTLRYLAPERFAGQCDARADIYALGLTLYEMLALRPAFDTPDRLRLIDMVKNHEPARPRSLDPHVPRDLETVVLKALDKDPRRRYATAAEMADDLRRFAEGEPVKARSISSLERAAKWARRNPGLAAMWALVFVSMATGTAVSTWFALDASDKATKLQEQAGQLAMQAEDLKVERNAAKVNEERAEKALARGLLAPLAVQGDNAGRFGGNLGDGFGGQFQGNFGGFGFGGGAFGPNFGDGTNRGFGSAISDGSEPLADPELEALWALVTNRSGKFSVLFIEEATSTPVTTRQLRDRASWAFHAAVGLDLKARNEVETLLLTRLEDNTSSSDHRRDIALATSRWHELSALGKRKTTHQLTAALNEATDADDLQRLAQGLSALAKHMDPSDAAQAAQKLTLGVKGAKDIFTRQSLADGLAAVAQRMEPRAAAQMLTAAMKDAKSNGLESLAKILAKVATRMEPKDAAQTLMAVLKNVDSSAFDHLASGLSATAARMQPVEAAQTLVVAMKEAKHSNVLRSLAKGLLAVAERMELRDAEHVAAQAAQMLMVAIKDANDAYNKEPLVSRLSEVTARMEPRQAELVAAQVAQTLVVAMKGKGDSSSLRTLARCLSAMAACMEPRDAALMLTVAINDHVSALEPLAVGLAAVAERMKPRDAAQTLTAAMKDAKDAGALKRLAVKLSEVTARMEPGDAAKLAAHTVQTLMNIIKDTKDAGALCELARGLAAVMAHLEPRDAAQTLTAVMKDAKETGALECLAAKLSEVTARMAPGDIAQIAQMLVVTMKDTKENHTLQLAKSLSAVVSRMEPSEAAQMLMVAMKDAKHSTVLLCLAEGLSGVAVRMKPMEGVQTLTVVMKDAMYASALGRLAQGLSAVAARMEPRDAAQVTAQAAQMLTLAIKDAKNVDTLSSLTPGLSAVVQHMELRDVSQVAQTLMVAMKATKGDDTLAYLAWSLSEVAKRLEPRDAAQLAAQAAQMLMVAFKDAKGSGDLHYLAWGLSKVAACMEPRDAAQVAAQAARTLMMAIKDAKADDNPQRLAEDQSPDDLQRLMWGLSAVAERMESRDVAQLTQTLMRAMKDAKDTVALQHLAEGLAEVAERMEPKDAARTLTAAMKDHKHASVLHRLAQSLVAMVPRLEPKDAARTLMAAMKNAKNDDSALVILADRLSATVDEMGSNDAAQLATIAVLQVDMHVKRDVYSFPQKSPPIDVPIPANQHCFLAVAVVGCEHPLRRLSVLAPQPKPLLSRLTTQQLVDLLKRPTCVPEKRTIVLDHLAERYQRPFADHFDFVRYATEQKLGLDFLSPPVRLDVAAAR